MFCVFRTQSGTAEDNPVSGLVEDLGSRQNGCRVIPVRTIFLGGLRSQGEGPFSWWHGLMVPTPFEFTSLAQYYMVQSSIRTLLQDFINPVELTF